MHLNAVILIRSLAILSAIATASIFVAQATRGLDFTDESYYILNFLHWQSLSSNVTFFGAFFEYPFRWLDYNLAAIRVFGLALLICASSYFVHAAITYVQRLTHTRLVMEKLTLLVAGLSIGMLYYGLFGTLRTPSYNTLTLVGILVSTGVVLKSVSVAPDNSAGFRSGLIYGLLVASLILVKATSAVAAVAVHLMIFVAHRGRNTIGASLPVVYGAVPAILFVVGVLTYLHPGWWSALQNGLELMNVRDGRSSHIIGLLRHFRWDLQKHVAEFWYAYTFIALFHLLVILVSARNSVGYVRWWIPILVFGLIAFVSLSDTDTPWLPAIILVTLLVWSTELFLRRPLRMVRSDLVMIGLAATSAVLSVAFSWGSGMTMTSHVKLAAALPMASLLVVIVRLKALQILNEQGFHIVILILVIPSLVFAGQPWWDVNSTYRLKAPLAQQDYALNAGGESNVVTVDGLTHQHVQQFQQIIRSNGFDQGDGMLDLTGDSPGLVYLAGGKPLGVAWLLGGYPGSSEQTSKLIGLLEPRVVRCAWLLTSEDAVRRIVDWKSILQEEYDLFDHIQIGELTTRPYYQWRGATTEPTTLAIWRPAKQDCG